MSRSAFRKVAHRLGVTLQKPLLVTIRLTIKAHRENRCFTAIVSKMKHKTKKQEKDEAVEEPKKTAAKTSFLRTLFGAVTETRDDDDDEDESSGDDEDDDDDESRSSWDGSESGSGGSTTDETSSELGLQAFDRQLRAKHAQACRAMTVSDDCQNGHGKATFCVDLTRPYDIAFFALF
jgi:hypothetical protein